MRIYLDDNFADRALVGALRKAVHLVSRPVDFALVGASDARHLERSIRENLVLLTKDRDDYRDLHELVLTCDGQHPGILVVCYENDAKRDMKTKHIIVAIERLEHAAAALPSQRIILNQWR